MILKNSIISAASFRPVLGWPEELTVNVLGGLPLTLAIGSRHVKAGPMFVHPYHFGLMRCRIRQKLKGDHRLRLSCADRVALVRDNKLKVSDSYIVKVISEADRRAGNLSQHVLDQLAHAIGHADWNGFLRTNPIPDGQFQQLLKAKFKKRLDALVEQRMADLRAEQAEDSEFRGNQ